MTDTSSEPCIVQLPRLFRMPEVKAFVRLSEPTIWRQIKQGSFPQPIRIGAKSVAWLEEELLQWVRLQTAERDKLGSLNVGGDDASQH